MGNLISNLQSKERHEWSLNDFPKYLFIMWEGIIFHLWKFSSQSFRSQDHCKLITFEDISTCFNPPFLRLWDSVLRLIFGREECHINFFWIFWSSSTSESRMTVKNIKINNFKNSKCFKDNYPSFSREHSTFPKTNHLLYTFYCIKKIVLYFESAVVGKMNT